MAGRKVDTRRRAERRRNEDREETREERARRLKRAREKKLRRRKRRLYFILFILFAIFLVCYIIKGVSGKSSEAKEAESVSQEEAKGLPMAGGAVGAGDDTALYTHTQSTPVSTNTAPLVDNGIYAGATDASMAIDASSPVDVTSGKAAINLEAVSGNSAAKISAAKAAMASNAYFTGTTRPVNDYFEEYGAGEWHGIMDINGEMCIFYDGTRLVPDAYSQSVSGNTPMQEIEYKVSFKLYEDGSFIVTGVEEGGSQVEDYQQYLELVVGF